MLAALAAAILPGVAMAQPVTGVYLGAGAGGNFMQPEKFEDIYHSTAPGASGVFRGKVHLDIGGAGVASVGYGFGNGFRIEAEGNYRYDALRGYPSGYAEQKYGGMGNLLFDFDIGSPYVFPYVGAGAGYMETQRSLALKLDSGAFAYQGIAGLALPIPGLPGLSATLEYRFLGLATTSQHATFAGSGVPVTNVTEKVYNDINHSAMIGLRYAFNVAPPPPPAAPVPATAAPAAAVDRSYLVFFDWDRSDLTARARQIVAEAAAASTRIATTRIEVQGNADRTGTPAYNVALSRRRAETVAGELVNHGVPRNEIEIQAFGDTHPLVPTAAGVREPQNRRVEIIFR